MTTDWNPLLRDQFDEPYWSDLMTFVKHERSQHEVYPPQPEVFAALHLTSFADTRVVILGQDPYHGPRQAHGLCFSVRRGGWVLDRVYSGKGLSGVLGRDAAGEWAAGDDVVFIHTGGVPSVFVADGVPEL